MYMRAVVPQGKQRMAAEVLVANSSIAHTPAPVNIAMHPKAAPRPYDAHS
jgi:hypothetical protein